MDTPRNIDPITPEPQAEIPAREVWLWQNPEALSSVQRGLADSAANRLTDRGSFAAFAEAAR